MPSLTIELPPDRIGALALELARLRYGRDKRAWRLNAGFDDDLYRDVAAFLRSRPPYEAEVQMETAGTWAAILHEVGAHHLGNQIADWWDAEVQRDPRSLRKIPLSRRLLAKLLAP